MGTGGTKAHESFTIATTSAAATAAATTGPGTTSLADPAGETEPPSANADTEPALGAATNETPPAPGESDDGDHDDVAGPAAASAPSHGLDVDQLTPLPDSLATGDPAGTPVLCGGGDLVDSTATLVAYESGQGPREVLVATIDEHAEAKVLEAIALTHENLVAVEVETEVHGRLPLDTQHHLHEQIEKVAKSVNHHLKAGDGIPAHTLANHAALVAQLDELEQATASEDEQAMLAYYKTHADAIAERLETGPAVDYAIGKVPFIGAYETTGTATITKWVPAPNDDPDDTRLAATMRDATRIAPKIGPNGTATWDGTSRTAATGKEYVIDLGDGYEAVYRPYGANDPASTEYSLRGALEIVAPAGGGHANELVHRLGQLHLVNQPMTAAEGEWTYLRRNIWAQQLETNPTITKALSEADGLESAVQSELWWQRSTQAHGLNETELHAFARQICLDAEARALPYKARILRDAVASVAGYGSGDALAATPGYDPRPQRSGGWFTWNRFDVAGHHDTVRTAFGSRGLYHSVTGQNLVEMLRTGVLASTERRHLMGIASGKGMSESADKFSGGASSVFLRVSTHGPHQHGAALCWDDPTQLMRRADWYAYNGDHYGAVNPASHHNLSSQTRNPHKVAKFTAHNNEIMFRNGLDLLGVDAPSRIKCATSAQRTEILDLLTAKGVTHLAGRPIKDVVTT